MADTTPSIPLDTFRQVDFSGGMNLFLDDVLLPDGQYGRAFNLRTRSGKLKSVRGSSILAGAPSGFKQAIVGFDNLLVAFIAGKAYYRTADNPNWNRVANFSMSNTAQRIYTCEIPATTFYGKRVLTEEDIYRGIKTTPEPLVIGNGVIGGLVCQDGTNQPWIIQSDGTARQIGNYDGWTLTNREYVPIGKQMVFMNGILFIASPDGKLLYRSVTGRPLDFVVAIDATSGNKLGNAQVTAYAVSYNEITCLKALNSGQLFVGTTMSGFPIDLDYERTIYGEPTFKNLNGFNSGVVNQNSFIELLGDYAWIDYNGVRSFNAVSQLNNEGRQSIFSKLISSILDGVEQKEFKCCATQFDNYALFALNTHFGYVVMVYDMLTQVWVCMDIIIGSAIKQFATIKESGTPRLFAIDDTEIIELYDSTQDYFTSSISPRGFVSANPNAEVALNFIRCIFQQGDDDTVVRATCYSNGKYVGVNAQQLVANIPGLVYPIRYPALYDSETRISNTLFNFDKLSSTGWKISVDISWKDGAELNAIYMEATQIVRQLSIQQALNVR